MAGGVLVVPLASLRHRLQESRHREPGAGLHRLEADVHDVEVPDVEPAGCDDHADLPAVKGHGLVGLHGGACDLAGRPVDA